MGIDLCQYSNHKINFSNREWSDIAKEITDKLNTLDLINFEHLVTLYDYFESSDYKLTDTYIMYKNKMKKAIYREIPKKKITWTATIREDEDYKAIECYGENGSDFRSFELSFEPDRIYFWDPPYRFQGWFYMDKATRNEWRKYMFQIINLFGGDRVIYIPGGMSCEGEMLYWNNEDLPLESIMNLYIEHFGRQGFNLDNVPEPGQEFYLDSKRDEDGDPYDGVYYYIDDFKDIEIKNEITLSVFRDFLWSEFQDYFKERFGKHGE